MAEIILELAGKGGLADNFAGNADMVTPQPQFIVDILDGQMAGGQYNPYLREGYLAPITTTKTTLTYNENPEDIFGSSIYDPVNNLTFFAERGLSIFIGDSLSSTLLNRRIFVGTGDVIHDLEIGEINSTRKLMYTYVSNWLTNELSTNYRSDWVSMMARVDAEASSSLLKIASTEHYGTGTTVTSTDFTIPSGSNMKAIIFVSVRGGTVTSVNIDGGAASKVSEVERNVESTVWNTYVYQKTVTSGIKSITVNNSGAYYTTINCIVYSGAHSTPISATDTRYANNFKPLNRIPTNDGSKYLQFTMALNSYFDIANITVGNTYSPSTQTGGNGVTVAFSNDGTKMYVDGIPSSITTIFQYTLSTAWDVATATYASKSKNIDSQINDAVLSINFSSDGTRMIARGQTSNSTIKYWALGTAWDISTATYLSSYDYTPSVSGISGDFGLAFNKDGTKMYTVAYNDSVSNGYYIVQYNLATAWLPSTATFFDKYTISEIGHSITVTDDGTIAVVKSLSSEKLYSYNFNPLFPGDVTKLETSYTSSSQVVTIPTTVVGTTIRKNGGRIYCRGNETDMVRAYNISTGSDPTISSVKQTTFSQNNTTAHTILVELNTSKTLDIGVVDFSSDMATPGSSIIVDENWLSVTTLNNISTTSDYNFLRNADNGYQYLFANNAVHKIDGGFSGGKNGTLTKNVLLFPENFTISDALDYRSNLYIAIHHYPVSIADTTLNTYVGKCGIVIWDRISSQLGGLVFIELPGVREIKKIYASPDGLLKLITISDNGLVQIRQFGYNDSGGVIFSTVKELGIGAYPQFPDSLSVASDKTVWAANDGKVYVEKGNAVTQLYTIKEAGATTQTLESNITSGAVLYGSGVETSDSGFRSNKQGVTISYQDPGIPSTLMSYSPTSNMALSLSSYYSVGLGRAFLVEGIGTAKMDRVVMQLKRIGTLTGNMYAKIIAHTGTYGSGTAGSTLTSPLATSDPVSAASLSTSATDVTFTFSGAQKIDLSAGTPYYAVVEYSTGGNIANYVEVPVRVGEIYEGNVVDFSSTISSTVTTSTTPIISAYVDGTLLNNAEKIYPFDLKIGDNSLQTPHQGDVYTGVKYIPVTSRVKRIRVYNAPIVGSGTDVIATVKIYFNQSTSPTIPNGMTKSITKDEAKRGYVDFNINKPYIHAVQLEVEWASSTPLGEDMYLPSIATISTEDTMTKTPDGE